MPQAARARTTGSLSRADAARADLVEGHWWLTATVDALDDHLYFGLLQPDGHFDTLFSGPNLDRLIGGDLATLHEDVNDAWQSRIDPADLEAYRACEGELLAGRPAQVDYRIHGLDGRIRWIRARVKPEQLGDGSVRFAGILSDITKQRGVEDDLRYALADLAEANTKLDAAHRRAVELAMTDALTGAANRRHVDRVLSDVLSADGQSIGVLLLDIDDFKEINDRFGHRVGDEVLIATVARLNRAVRPDDVVARWGGEEFLLLCRTEKHESVRAIAERIRASIGRRPFATTAGDIAVTASVGAVSSRGLAQAAEPLIDAADASLLAAKRAGKNCTVVARPPRAHTRAA